MTLKRSALSTGLVICFLVTVAAREVMNSAVQYAKSQGIQINEKNSTEHPDAGNSK